MKWPPPGNGRAAPVWTPDTAQELGNSSSDKLNSEVLSGLQADTWQPLGTVAAGVVARLASKRRASSPPEDGSC